MSFSIIINVYEGMVLASDRRSLHDRNLYTNLGDIKTIERSVFITDSVDKVFECPNGSGIVINGEYVSMKNSITVLMKRFIREKIHEHTDVKEIPSLMIDYFKQIAEPINSNAYIAGYDKKGPDLKQRLFHVSLSTLSSKEIALTVPGAFWSGVTEPMDRMFQRVWEKRGEEYSEFSFNEVLWEYFTLQDAVDFSRYAAGLTENMMRFWSRTKEVGGGPDVLMITPEKTKWIEKEEIH